MIGVTRGLRRRPLLFTAVLLAAAAAAWLLFVGHRVPAGQEPLATIRGRTLAPLKTAFNRGSSGVRVVLLLSPT